MKRNLKKQNKVAKDIPPNARVLSSAFTKWKRLNVLQVYSDNVLCETLIYNSTTTEHDGRIYERYSKAALQSAIRF